jgi:hypothetical protein
MRLVNPSGQAVSIEKVTLMSVRPKALGTWPAARLLKAHGTQETTQEFKISTPEYQSWEKGLRPLVRVEMRTEKGQRTSQTVRLNGVPLQ